MLNPDSRLSKSFNSIKNIIYKNNYDIERYDFSEIVELIIKEDLTQEELFALNKIYEYISEIYFSVQDIGTKLVEIDLVIDNKLKLNQYILEIIEKIDLFIDSLRKIISIFEFDNDYLNIEISLARLETARNSIIKSMNELRFLSSIKINEKRKKRLKIFLTDIIDMIIQESMRLSINKLYIKLAEKVND